MSDWLWNFNDFFNFHFKIKIYIKICGIVKVFLIIILLPFFRFNYWMEKGSIWGEF
jgi:hypothetical protein